MFPESQTNPPRWSPRLCSWQCSCPICKEDEDDGEGHKNVNISYPVRSWKYDGSSKNRGTSWNKIIFFRKVLKENSRPTYPTN